MKLRKLNRSVHRDLGYIFFFMTIIYGLSGIALNHIDDWNPSYIIKNTQITIKEAPIKKENINRSEIISILETYAPEEKYKNHYFSSDNNLKIFIKNGNITLDIISGNGVIETSKRRPVFHQFNYLHYNPQKWWTVISDIYAVCLMLLAITGLFILKGKNGITRRGAWLTLIGVIIPIAFLLIAYWKIF